jgi:glycosyltransferase involved in cell wall biosynthesis
VFKVNGRFLLQNTTGVQRVAIEMSSRLNLDVIRYPNKGWFAHLYEQIFVPFLTKDGYISFCNVGPVFARNHIVYIHDVAVIEHPEWFAKKFSLYYSIMLPLIARFCKHIVTVSEYSKERIVKVLKVSPDKVTVIPNGVSEFFTNDSGVLVEKYGLQEGKYLLSVGSIEPRKNLDTVVQAWHQSGIKKQGYKLALVGGGIASFSDVDLFIDNSVILTGYVSDEELLALYRRSSGFIYMSKYEGFGLPVLEAMKAGIPVLTSNSTALLETASNYALTCSPEDVQGIAKKMDALSDVDTQTIQAAKEYADQFTWDSAVEKLKALLERV